MRISFYPFLLFLLISILSSKICSEKKKMSQAAAAAPSALCKLKQRDVFPSSSLVIGVMGEMVTQRMDEGEENGRWRAL